jgi:ADP-dependent NAD(P)H-hydrate dehydratase / NAD(P)H-hydrate epimerase
MRPLLSPDEMARADRATIESGTSAYTLMERAGRAVARAVIELAGGRYGRRVVVVVGKGNNGGDGLVAARALAAEGLAVRCMVLSDELEGAAREHLERMIAAGVRPTPFDAGALGGAGVVVDAVFGTGFRGAAGGRPAQAIQAINASPAAVVAVDVPSGVDGLTGAVNGPAVTADVTVAMGAEKYGTALPPGSTHAGRVRVADIGISVEPSNVSVMDGADVARVLPARPSDAHKRSVGSVALLAGSDGMSGAAILAARGAVLAGAGYATLVTTPYVDHAKKTLVPEVLSKVIDAAELGPEALEGFPDVVKRSDAIAIGPGIGQGARQRDLVSELLRTVEAPVVLDADGLNVLAGNSEVLRDRHGPAVITPHPGEMARLLGTSSSEVQRQRLVVATGAAAELSCIVILKGASTVVAEPSGRAVVNQTGGPELATAGTGDVLTGVVAALLAMGVPAFEAAWSGVFVHGVAGRLAGSACKGHGVLAGDVAAHLPLAFATLFG